MNVPAKYGAGRTCIKNARGLCRGCVGIFKYICKKSPVRGDFFTTCYNLRYMCGHTFYDLHPISWFRFHRNNR